MKYSINIGGRLYQAEILDLEKRPVVVIVDGQQIEVWPESEPGQVSGRSGSSAPVELPKTSSATVKLSPQPASPTARSMEKALRAPIPGVILQVNIAVGDAVSPGQELFVIEAMKMRNVIRSTRAGVVAALHVSPGQTVNYNDLLVEFAGHAGQP